MTFEVRLLPAAQGDAIWLRWGSHQALVDMGTEQTGNAMARRLSDLPEEQRRFSLLVVTHVDRDHIGGVLTCVSQPAEPVPGLRFDDVWFNGWDHLNGRTVAPPKDGTKVESMGPAQGERLGLWLRDQPWNEAFDRAAVVVPDTGPLTTVTLPGELHITVLGPSRARLERLVPTWKEEVDIALAKGTLPTESAKLESLGSKTPPVLETRTDLELLAEAKSPTDPSRTNGSSITLLVEHRGRRVLLTGDAFGDDVAQSLDRIGGGSPVAVDLVKLPHHGSRQNVTRSLVEALSCTQWAFSSDGSIFRHPDAQAVARVLTYGTKPRPKLLFNVPSKFNTWWDNPLWRKEFDYVAVYGDPVEGLVVPLPPNSARQATSVDQQGVQR